MQRLTGEDHKDIFIIDDTQFVNPHQIVAIKDMNLDTIAMVKTLFRATEEQLEVFAAGFYSRLPEYMQRALNYTPYDGPEAISHG
ncbi:hypothetical protein ACQQ9V_04625 [Hornefia butyriciproducens]|uniref:hypothetical protein n=1 Tax=Hornefia butyriciproducens TaxID=2652293 RepID=UPI003CFEF30F